MPVSPIPLRMRTMNRSEEQGSSRFSVVAHWGLWLGPSAALSVGLLLPWPAEGSDAARSVAAVAVWMAVWWFTQALPLAATALLPIVLFPYLGVMSIQEVTREYAGHLVFLFLSGFLLASALQRWKIDRRLALSLVYVMGNSTRRIVFGVMLASAILSMGVSNSATAAMMMPVGLALAGLSSPKNDAREHDSPFATSLMLGIAYGASIGGVGTLIGTPPNVILASILEENTGERLTFWRWMLIGVPVVAVILPLAWFWLVYGAYPPERSSIAGGRRAVAEDLRALGTVGKAERWTVAVVALTATLWVSRPLWEGLLPNGRDAVSDASIGVAGALLLFILPSHGKAGSRLLDAKAIRALPWDVLLLFGGGLALARALEVSGLALWLGETVVARANLPWPLFLLLTICAVVFLTEVASNTATTAMVLPLLLAAASVAGHSALALMAPAAIAASMAFMMPAATPPNAIVFGTGRVSLGQMLRAGFVLNIVAVVVLEMMALWLFPLYG